MKKLILIAVLLSLLTGCQIDTTTTRRVAFFRADENGPDNHVADSRRAGMSTGTGWNWGNKK